MGRKNTPTDKAAAKKAAKQPTAKKNTVGKYPPNQKIVEFKFKAKPGTYEAILEAAAFAKKAKLKNYARS